MKILLPSASVASSCCFLAWFLTLSGILEALAKTAENKGSVCDEFPDITEAVLAKKDSQKWDISLHYREL